MKTIIITGANGNLGTAVTNAFLHEGYRVVATIHNESMRKDVAPHERLELHTVDLSDETAANDFVSSVIARHGHVHAALLLVGGFAMGGMAQTSITDIRRQIALNFETAYHVAHPLFQHMLDNNDGRIVFIGSRPALEASYGKDMIAYGLSKSLLFKLADYMNAAAKGKNVTATVAAPSTLDTPLNRQSMPGTDPSTWVKPEALAELLAFIVSEKAGTLRETVLKVYNNA